MKNFLAIKEDNKQILKTTYDWILYKGKIYQDYNPSFICIIGFMVDTFSLFSQCGYDTLESL